MAGDGDDNVQELRELWWLVRPGRIVVEKRRESGMTRLDSSSFMFFFCLVFFVLGSFSRILLLAP